MQLAYRPGNSLFHKIDPLMKSLWVLVVAFWLYSLRDISSVTVVSLAITAFALLSAKLKLKRYLKLSGLIFFGSGFLILYQGVFRPGPGIPLGPVVLSYSGMSLGLAIGLRTFGLVAASLAFSVTTSPQELELSLVKIGMPYKIARICYLSLRLFPVFQRDVQAIQDVQHLRGVGKRWKRLRTSVVPLVLTELRQADSIAIALETRGFGLHDTRTELEEVTVSQRGKVLVFSTTLLMVLQYVYIHSR